MMNILTILILVLLSGCSSIKLLPLEDRDNFKIISSSLEVGEHIIVTTKLGERFDFIVEAISESNISGEEVKFFGDKVSISIHEISEIKIDETGGFWSSFSSVFKYAELAGVSMGIYAVLVLF